MRKPTAGPWNVTLSDNKQAYEIRAGVFLVAMIARTPYSVADAYLIGTAPEMLEKLKAYQAMNKRKGRIDKDLNEIISKAEGK